VRRIRKLGIAIFSEDPHIAGLELLNVEIPRFNESSKFAIGRDAHGVFWRGQIGGRLFARVVFEINPPVSTVHLKPHRLATSVKLNLGKG